MSANRPRINQSLAHAALWMAQDFVHPGSSRLDNEHASYIELGAPNAQLGRAHGLDSRRISFASSQLCRMELMRYAGCRA